MGGQHDAMAFPQRPRQGLFIAVAFLLLGSRCSAESVGTFTVAQAEALREAGQLFYEGGGVAPLMAELQAVLEEKAQFYNTSFSIGFFHKGK